MNQAVAEREQAEGEQAGGAGVQSSAEEMARLLEDARSKADEQRNQYLRVVAELDNLRKRSERELENAYKYTLEKFAVELLPVKDSLEMGLSAVESGGADPAKLKEGMDLTLKMLSTAMERFNIREVNPQGERFNPELHQAMSVQVREDVEPDRVVTVIQKGYLLNERLIRPALVIVSRAPDAPKVDERA